MEAREAVRLINDVSFKPGWKIMAEVFLPGLPMVAVTAHVDTVNSDRDNALNDYAEEITIAPDTMFDASEINTPDELYAQLLAWLIRLEIHECREFFRVGARKDAPFHPHKREGEQRWNALI